MLKHIVLGMFLLAGLLVGTAWADDELNKALFDAVIAGKMADVETLIVKGADVNTHKGDPWRDGSTPLHRATLQGSKDIVELLISQGADVNAKNDNGATPLYFAHNKNLSELLVAKGAKVNTKDNLGRTPLHFNDGQVAELLIAKGADLNAKNNEGNTRLHDASISLDMQLVTMLISKNADATATNKDGLTPLQLLESKPIPEGKLCLTQKYEQDVGCVLTRQQVVSLLQAAQIKSFQKLEEMEAKLEAAMQNKTGNQRETFSRVVSSYKDRAMSDAIRRPFIALAAKLKPAPNIPEEAIKYEGRAQFAFKNAESPADVLSAAREYEKAVAVAPWVPGYYADLCTIYEKAKKYTEAKKNCEFFLASSPSAQEASDTSKRIAGLEFAIEKMNSPEAQAAREVESQREKNAALKNSLDGAVFVKRVTVDYGTAEWEIRINSGEATYSYDVIAWATSDPPCEKIGMRRPCGTWRQILMNSWYSGSRMDLASGRLAGRQFTLVRAVSSPGLEAGSMPCEVSSDGASITCSGELIDGKTFLFRRR